jgi:heme-degrading monooxygenase HmoA
MSTMIVNGEFHFAELNIARLHRRLDEPENAEFVAALDAVNLIAERTPGFVWRLQGEGGASSSYVTAYDDPLLIVNLTVWEDVESLRHFTNKSGHGAYLRRRREWFEAPTQPHMVCWWSPVGALPTVADATRRLELLRVDGPSADGFLFTDPLPTPANATKS